MRRLSIALVFLAGCAVGGGAGQLVVPKARAADVQRWEHFCMVVDSFSVGDMNQRMRKPGREGFELVTVNSTGNVTVACFKRPADG